MNNILNFNKSSYNKLVKITKKPKTPPNSPETSKKEYYGHFVDLEEDGERLPKYLPKLVRNNAGSSIPPPPKLPLIPLKPVKKLEPLEPLEHIKQKRNYSI